MRLLRLLLIAAVFFAGAARAEDWTPVGQWLTGDSEGVVEIYRCGAGLCGRIAGITLDHPDDPTPRDIWGRPQCDETILVAQHHTPDGLWHGEILDPRSGRRYQAEFHLGKDGRLKLRGYIGLPLLGQTQSWSRFSGPIGAHCILPQRPARNASNRGRS